MQRIGTEQHQRADPFVAVPPAGGRRHDRRGVPAPLVGHRAPGAPEPLATVLEGHPARQHPRGHAHVDRAVHVATSERRHEARIREGAGDDLCGLRPQLARLGEGGPADDHDKAVRREQPARLGQRVTVGRSGGLAVPGERLRDRDGFAGPGAHRGCGVSGERAPLRRDLDQ